MSDRTGEVTLLQNETCPRCGNFKILCYLLTDEKGQHMHTRYVCTFYGAGRRAACEWSGWVVPDA